MRVGHYSKGRELSVRAAFGVEYVRRGFAWVFLQGFLVRLSKRALLSLGIIIILISTVNGAVWFPQEIDDS